MNAIAWTAAVALTVWRQSYFSIVFYKLAKHQKTWSQKLWYSNIWIKIRKWRRKKTRLQKIGFTHLLGFFVVFRCSVSYSTFFKYCFFPFVQWKVTKYGLQIVAKSKECSRKILEKVLQFVNSNFFCWSHHNAVDWRKMLKADWCIFSRVKKYRIFHMCSDMTFLSGRNPFISFYLV